MSRRGRDYRVLAVDPTSRGFGYAILEGPEQLIDWGVREGPKASNPWAVGHVTKLIGRYVPDLLILEDVTKQDTRRRERVRHLLHELEELARANQVEVASISRRRMKRMFASAEAKNKEQIADTIVQHFPELSPSRPPVRKPWVSEDPRMAIFDATAFALTYFYFEDEKPHAA